MKINIKIVLKKLNLKLKVLTILEFEFFFNIKYNVRNLILLKYLYQLYKQNFKNFIILL